MTEDVKALIAEEKEKEITDKENLLKSQRKEDLANISKSEQFLKASEEINTRDVAVSMRKKANEIQNEELQRDWEEYLLQKKKEEQDYRTKLEKDLLKKEIQAEINEKKRLIAERRYGYLYDQKELNGKIVYKDFTQSKTINRFKELNNWYKNLSENMQKAISTTVKFIIKAGVSISILYIIYQVLKFVNNLGFTV